MAALSTLKKPAAAVTSKKKKQQATPPPQEQAQPSGSPAKGGTAKAEPISPAKPKGDAKHPPIPKDAAKRMHSKLKTLAKQGKGDLQKAYQLCKTHDEKRAFFYDKYVLDPDVSEKVVLKKDTEESVVTEDHMDGWFTAEEVAGFKGITAGHPQYAQLVQASVKDLPERDHEDQHLAALGVKQFHYVATKTKSQTLKRKGLELTESVAEVDQEDFTEMRHAMSGQPKRMIGSSSSKGHKAAQAAGGPDPGLQKAEAEVELEVNWHQALKDQHKKCKAALQQVATECHSCEMMLEKIGGLSDSVEMKPLLLKAVTAQKEDLEKKKKQWQAQSLQFPKVADNEASAEDLSNNLAQLVEAVTSALKAFRKEISAHKRYLEKEEDTA